MLDAIRNFVSRRILPAAPPGTGNTRGSAAAAGNATGSTTGSATGTPPDAREHHGLHLAACALLLEIAHADGEFSAGEIAHIEGALQRHFGLDHAEISELIALADAERRDSIDHFQFTRLLAQSYDVGQKLVLAEVMWGVVLADGTVSDHEAYIVRKVANLLDLEPAYLSQARAAASKPRAP